jgi:hypothetical protein
MSKEGIGRAERGGKDASGSYVGNKAGDNNPLVKNAKLGAESITSGAKTVGTGVGGLHSRSGGKGVESNEGK